MTILKELRSKTGLTLRQVEEATGISNAYLSQLETGKIKRPSAQALYCLSKIYNISVEELLVSAGLIKNNERVMPLPPSTPEDRITVLEEKIRKLEIKVEGLSLDLYFK